MQERQNIIFISNNYSKRKRLYKYLEEEKERNMNITVIICTEGVCDITLNEVRYSLTPQDFIIIAPGSSWKIEGTKNKYDFISINPEILLFKESQSEIIQMNRLYNEYPCNKLPDKKYLMYKIIYHYLMDFQNENISSGHKLKIVQSYVNVLFYEACSIINESMTPVQIPQRNSITKRFLTEVENSFRKEKKLSYYAGRIGVTAKHLSDVISKETGYTASKWIEEYTLSEAKKMLREGELSAQEISYELSFSTPSHFGAFFRKKTGMTPKEYSRKWTTLHNEASHQELPSKSPQVP